MHTKLRWIDPFDGSEMQKQGSRFVSKTNNYRIIRGISRFVDKENYNDSFGFQWNQYKETQLDSYIGFPLTKNRLERCVGEKLFERISNKLVLEAGCGAGRFTEILLEREAFVVSMDMSSAVEANKDNFSPNDRHIIVQADILKMPFADQQFDIIICLGVIQHTPCPEDTIRALYRKVRPGGWLVLDHYIYSVSYFTQIPKILLRLFLRPIEPLRAFRIINLVVKIFLPLHRLGRTSRLWQAIMRRTTPVVSYYYDFPNLPDSIQREWAQLDTFDNLTDYYKHFRSIKQIKNCMRELGMDHIKCWKGGNGIEARGRRPDADIWS
jgi:2-polyprenyl-3-methyl-5-hydroxy-6-metoxy-1,4-benzoquinol methylase|tara:strand:- start:33 stop:1004 length:972 start_codon:yes stop_codon:yes gene_type:complete